MWETVNFMVPVPVILITPLLVMRFFRLLDRKMEYVGIYRRTTNNTRGESGGQGRRMAKTHTRTHMQT